MLEWPRGQGRDGTTFFKQLNIITAVFIPLLFSFKSILLVCLPTLLASNYCSLKAELTFLGNAFRPVTLAPPPKIKFLCSTSYLDNLVRETRGRVPVDICQYKEESWISFRACRDRRKHTISESFLEKQNKATMTTFVGYWWFILAATKSAANHIILYAIR